MITKKHIVFLSVSLVMSATIMHAETQTPKETTVTSIVTKEDTASQTAKNSSVPNYISMGKIAAGTAICMLPSVKIVRWTVGAALALSGAYDLRDTDIKKLAKETFLHAHSATIDAKKWCTEVWNEAQVNAELKDKNPSENKENKK